MNMSSEITQFNNARSCFVNSLIIDDTHVNSFCSPRAGSVTVVGKRIYSHSCISPSVIEEQPRFPIPIQVFTRINRHKIQAKKMLKQRISKYKCQEQPAPPVAKSSKPIQNLHRRKETIKNSLKTREKQAAGMKENKSCTKLLHDENKPAVALTERSVGKILQIIKSSVKSEMQIKRKKELEKKLEGEFLVKRRQLLQKQNSKIRLENSVKFKMEKFSPRAAWGIDERKYSECERQKLIKEIENQRNARRAEKNGPAYKKKRELGLSNFLEIENELGFKPRSSSVISEAPLTLTVLKKPDPRIKTYIKEKKKKNLKKSNDALIENLKQETKRIVNLKILDMKPEKKKQSKKAKKILKKPKKPEKFIETFGEAEKNNYEEHFSSDLIFEPDSVMKEDLSGFSEESDQGINPLKDPSIIAPDEVIEQSSDLVNEKAAIRIQSHIRGFLARKRYKRGQCSYSREDNEVRNIISSWQQSISEIHPQEPDSYNNLMHDQLEWQEAQMETLQKLKQNEISEVLEIYKQHQQDPQLIDSITKIINSRYAYISNILQKSGVEDSEQFIDPTSSIVEEEIEESDKNTEVKCLDFSFPSYRSEKSLQEISEKKIEYEVVGEIVVFEEFKIENVSIEENSEKNDLKNPGKVLLVSRASPISDASESEPMGKVSDIITPSMICMISELLLFQCLDEELYPYKVNEKQFSISKDPLAVQELLDDIFMRNNSDLKITISKPLKKNPLEILAKMQDSEKPIQNYWDYSSCHAILSPKSITEISNKKQELGKPEEKEINEAQRIHDKMIFDNCNEFLQDFRPYGTKGFPMPWSGCKRILKSPESDFSEIFWKLGKNIQELSNFNAGKIPDQAFLMSTGANERSIQNIRDEKLGILIGQDIVNNEGVWVDYEFEEMQVVLDAADSILNELVFEAMEIIN